jgi:hypothetical protein
MYSKNAWGGPVDPFILTVFPNKTVDGVDDPIVSFVVFEWNDYPFIGMPIDGNAEKDMICTAASVAKGHCNDSNIGEFILAPNATEKSGNLILTKAIHLKSSAPINYPIRKTGYYCVAVLGFTPGDFMGVVEFREAYGELPATQIPKLPFYGGVTILYALVCVYVQAIISHLQAITDSSQVLGLFILPAQIRYP